MEKKMVTNLEVLEFFTGIYFILFFLFGSLISHIIQQLFIKDSNSIVLLSNHLVYQLSDIIIFFILYNTYKISQKFSSYLLIFKNVRLYFIFLLIVFYSFAINNYHELYENKITRVSWLHDKIDLKYEQIYKVKISYSYTKMNWHELFNLYLNDDSIINLAENGIDEELFTQIDMKLKKNIEFIYDEDGKLRVINKMFDENNKKYFLNKYTYLK